jgi:hypothetical protein
MALPLRATRSSRTAAAQRAPVRVADEVWIATALLHREHPERADFSVSEIVERARKEHLTETLRPGVYVHASLHCVANLPPNPGRYRMLIETIRQRRRLFRPGDPFAPARKGSKTVPADDAIPARYRQLLKWYADWTRRAKRNLAEADPLLALRGSGRHVWKDEDPDDYVRRLREG